MTSNIDLSSVFMAVEASEPVRVHGRISEVIGLLIESVGPVASVGDICTIENNGTVVGRAEVVGFRKERTLLMPLGTVDSLHSGLTVVSTKKPLMAGVGDDLLGRVLDGLGNPLDGKGGLNPSSYRPVYSRIPNPLNRKRISEPLETGVKAIDAMLTIGKGQRIGIFSASGVGKSVLLGMMAKNCSADVNVIALIGERGREVREFIERDLGEEGLKKSVVIVATSDQPALIRLKGAMMAASIAEYFRDTGRDVLWLCDSVTRLATAQREIGLAIGEPPATKGYTPSVFAMMPSLLERAGTSDKGSITGMFTVLVEGDDMDEPIADTARSILDGHIVLSRQLANRNHFPAIDVLRSISRCMPDVITGAHQSLVNRAKALLSAYRENEDLITIGAYVNGTNGMVDKAIRVNPQLTDFLRQNRSDKVTLDEALKKLAEIDKFVNGQTQ